MIGETHILKKVDEDINEMAKRRALIFEDDLILKRFGVEKSNPVEGSICDSINEGSVTFIWYQSNHYQAHVPKSDEKLYNERSFLALCQKPISLFLWEFKFNSTCQVRTRNCSFCNASVYCDVYEGCAKCTCFVKEFHNKHSKTKNVNKKTFNCYYCMSRIKLI